MCVDRKEKETNGKLERKKVQNRWLDVSRSTSVGKVLYHVGIINVIEKRRIASVRHAIC
jgi:hypothetical protein